MEDPTSSPYHNLFILDMVDTSQTVGQQINMSSIAFQKYHPFTILPPEVRLQILGYLLPMNELFVICRDKSAPHVGQARRLTAHINYRSSITNLLLVDQQTSCQVLDIIYGCNTFTWHDPWLIETFMIRIGRANLHRIGHVQVQSGLLTDVNNDPTTSTLLSAISNNFAGLQTLRVIGLGRGKVLCEIFYPTLWYRTHLERMEFMTSLSGVLKNAKVYCDKEELNTRLLCNGAQYRTEWDEVEIDIAFAREEIKNQEKLARKRKSDGGMADQAVLPQLKKTNAERKKPKVKLHYEWSKSSK